MRRFVIATVSVALTGGMLVGLVWLRDIRLSYDRARLESTIAEKRITVVKLQASLSTLRDYLDTDAPLESRLARVVRDQNRQLTDREFRLWFEQNKARLREGAENDCRLLPTVLEERRREIQRMEDNLDALGRPWLFGSTESR